MHQIRINNRDIAIPMEHEPKYCINSLRPDFGDNRNSIRMGGSREVQAPNNLETDPLTRAEIENHALRFI